MGNKPNTDDHGPGDRQVEPLTGAADPPAPTARQRRRGPGSPGKKATAAEFEERVAAVARMLAARIPKHSIKQAIATKFDLGPRSAEAYISRAREWMLSHLSKPREDFVAEAVGFYEGIIRDPEASTRDKMEAQAGLRQLLGLDKPLKIAATDPEGQAAVVPITVIQSLSMEELTVLRNIHLRSLEHKRVVEGRVVAGSNGHGHLSAAPTEGPASSNDQLERGL